jgi:transcriptional regulator with XRE-family HTH domain
LNVSKLRGKIGEKNVKYKDLARAMGISSQALNKKMRGITRFNTDDVINICNTLGIDDDAERGEIFLR